MPIELGSHTGLLDRMYRRLGANYPTAFLIVELQSAFLITAGAILLLSKYYEADGNDVLSVMVVAVAINAVAVFAGIVRAHRRLGAVRRWIAGRRDPDATVEAWQTAAGLPLDLLRRDMPLPVFVFVLPTCVITVVMFDLAWTAFFPIFAGSLVAVGYASILHYFALETGMRPVVLEISEHLPPQFDVGRARLPLAVKLLGTLPVINIITGLTVAALTNEGEGGRALAVSVLIATAVAFTISFELSVMLTKSILRPVNDMRRATARVAAGDYEVKVPLTTGDELGELSASFNEMAAGLAERERLREAFGTYLDREVAAHILASPEIPRGVTVDISILFMDVRDFTRFAGTHDAPDVVAALNAVFERVVPVVEKHGGHVDKFIGDGLLALFGTPEPRTDHADRALAAALDIVRLQERGALGRLEISIGINSGPVLAGSIGGAGRLNFSVIGDAVNVASRVEGLTRQTGDTLLITAETAERLKRTPPAPLVPRGSFPVKGKDGLVEVLTADPSAATAEPAPQASSA